MNAFANSLIGLSLAVAAGTAGARADILALGANINLFNVTATEQPVPLTTNGAKAITFTTTRNNTVVVVTYNAECAATGAPGNWVSIRIAVDGINAAPQGGMDFALCSAVDSVALISTAASRQAVIRVPNAGLHTVQVFAILQRATTGRLDDSSIVIKD